MHVTEDWISSGFSQTVCTSWLPILPSFSLLPEVQIPSSHCHLVNDSSVASGPWRSCVDSSALADFVTCSREQWVQ